MALPSPEKRPPVSRPPLGEAPARRSAGSPAMSLLLPEGVGLPAARRLVVLVPDVDLDETALARRIWSLASPNKLSVLYQGVARSPADEPRARRRLATLAALTRDDSIKAGTGLALETDWLGALMPQLCSGDLIVCHAEQKLSSWRGTLPLGGQLCQALQAPVHLLSGFYAGDPAEPAHRLGRVVFWGGAVAILAVAFWLQVQITALPRNWAESALMALSVVAECGLIGLWNRAFN